MSSHLERFSGGKPPQPETTIEGREPLFVPCFDVLTISGRPGTGKTAVGTLLSQRYGMTFIKIGEIFRELHKKQIVGFQDRPESLDNFLDSFQAQLIRNVHNTGQRIIIEGKLSGVIATEEIANAARSAILYDTKPLNVIRINYTAPGPVRDGRILRREQKRNPSLTLPRVRRLTREREKGDFEQWGKLHPEIAGVDIFSPNARYNPGGVYHPKTGELVLFNIIDYNISTKQRSVAEVVEETDRILLEEDWLRKI